MAEEQQKQFDQALDAILVDIQPHEKECGWASKSPYCQKLFFYNRRGYKVLSQAPCAAANPLPYVQTNAQIRDSLCCCVSIK